MSSRHETEEGLVRHLQAAPEDLEAWSVYGDLLQERGDPRGEIIRLELLLTDQPEDAALRSRIDGLVEVHRKDWLGEVELKGDEWRFGYIETLRFHGSPAELKGLLGLKAMRFVRMARIYPSEERRHELPEVPSRCSLVPAIPSLLCGSSTWGATGTSICLMS